MAFNPFFFNDSPLPLELIKKLCVEYKALKKRLDDDEKIMYELSRYLRELESTVNEEVREVINNMYESGEITEILQSLINEELIREMRKTIISPNELPVQHLESRFLDSGMYQMRYDYDTDPVTRYSVLQGGCTFVKNGIRYYICGFVARNCVTNQCCIRMFRADTYAPIFEYYNNLGHCNGLAYDTENDYLYIAHSSEYENSQLTGAANYFIAKDIQRASTNKISRLSLTWNNYDTTITAGNFETKIFNRHAYDVDYYDGTVNAFIYETNFKGVAPLDWNNGVINFDAEHDVNLNDLDIEGSPTLASLAINDRYIVFAGFSPNNIYVLDKTNIRPTLDNGGVIQIIRTPQYIEHTDAFGEVEFIDFEENGDLYIGTFTEGQGAEESEFNNFNFCKSNLYRGISRRSEHVEKNSYTRSIFVKIDSLSNETYANNLLHANGTVDLPFPTLQHAMNAINADPGLKAARIKIYANIGAIYSARYHGNKNLDIIQYSSDDYTNAHITDTDGTINGDLKNGVGGLFVENSNPVSLRGVYSYQRHNDFEGSMYGSIICTNGDITIRNCRTSQHYIDMKYPSSSSVHAAHINRGTLYYVKSVRALGDGIGQNASSLVVVGSQTVGEI